MSTEARVTAVIEAKDQASGVLGSVTNSFSIFQNKLVAAGAAVTAIGAGMVKIANDTASFNQWIARAGANVEATTQQLDEFKKVAIDATKDTMFNAEQGAAALYQLAGGGIDAKDAMVGLQQAVKFATANGLDNLDEAAIAVANVMTIFKLRGDDAAKAMDVLTTAGHDAFGTTQDLVAAFKEAGPIAASVGISVEQLSGLLAALGDAGFQGTEAGVDLKRAIEQLVSPSGQAQDAVQSLGLKLSDSQGNFVGLANALDQLEDKLKDTTAMERATLLTQIFGQQAGPAMVALLGEGKEARAGYIQDMENAAGSTDKAAAAIEQTVNPIKKLQDRFFELETKVAPAVTTAINGIVGAIDLVTPVIDFLWKVEVEGLSNAFLAIANGWNWITNTVGPALVNTITAISSAMEKAIGIAQTYIKKTQEAIGNVTSAVGNTVSNVASGVGNFVNNAVNKIGSILSFDTGGIVPGPLGSAQMAVVHGGERVIPVSGMAGYSGGTGININITGNSISNNVDMRMLAEQVGREVMRSLKRAQNI